MSNIIKLDTPQRVNTIEWSTHHPDCDAIILHNEGDAKHMYIVAYANNPTANRELRAIVDSNKEYGLFSGISSSMLEFLGKLR